MENENSSGDDVQKLEELLREKGMNIGELVEAIQKDPNLLEKIINERKWTILSAAKVDDEGSSREEAIQSFLDENASREEIQLMREQEKLSIRKALEIAVERGLMDKNGNVIKNNLKKCKYTKDQLIKYFTDHPELFRKENQDTRTMGQGVHYDLLTQDGVLFSLSREGDTIDWTEA